MTDVASIVAHPMTQTAQTILRTTKPPIVDAAPPAVPPRVEEGANDNRLTQRSPPPAIAPGEHAMSAPPGFANFQFRYPGEIQDGAPALAAREQIDVARRINASVNEAIVYRPTKLWTVESGGPAYGDCKSYALTKRHILRGLGIPDGAFRDVVLYADTDRKLHMIVEMRSVDGIYVLDSLPNGFGYRFYTAAEMPSTYSIIEYQVWGRPEQWVAPDILTSENTVRDWPDHASTRNARAQRAYAAIGSSISRLTGRTASARRTSGMKLIGALLNWVQSLT
jgi:predicted transglutaminase-like cysteine proteinase